MPFPPARRPAAPILASAVLLLAFLSPASVSAQKTPAKGAKPTEAEARKLIADVSARLLHLSIEAGRAQWVQSTFITYDTEILAAKRNEALLNVGVALA